MRHQKARACNFARLDKHVYEWKCSTNNNEGNAQMDDGYGSNDQWRMHMCWNVCTQSTSGGQGKSVLVVAHIKIHLMLDGGHG